MTRTDCHRPSAIVPADYEQHVDYDCGGLYPERPFNVDCTAPVPTVSVDGAIGTYRGTHGTGDRCCVRKAVDVAREQGREVVGGQGKCGVCGAHFRYGTLFMHASGALVHMGHDCASKYQMLYDDSATEIARGRHQAAIAKHVQRAQNDKERAAFLAKHEGLADDLALGEANSSHRGRAILADLSAKFTTYRTMSDKQVAFTRKLADDVRNPRAVVEEKHVAAPTGKGVKFEGTIVSAKLREGDYGVSWKITVKVETDAGSWIAWGTAPASLMDLAVAIADRAGYARSKAYRAAADVAIAAGEDLPPVPQRQDSAQEIRAALVGLVVEVKATLELPKARDGEESKDHFVFMSRPQVYPTTWTVARNPKVIKAESDFAKLVYSERQELDLLVRAELFKRTGSYAGFKYATDRHAVASLALCKGITRSSFIFAATTPKTRGKRSRELT